MPLATKPTRAMNTIHGPMPRSARLATPGDRRSNVRLRTIDRLTVEASTAGRANLARECK
jgi:hypothetical protein